MLEAPWKAGSWKELIRRREKGLLGNLTPPCPFSQVQFKLNPAMRNDLSPGSDPLNAWRMNSSLVSPLNYSRAHKTLAGLWNPTSRLTGVWQMALMILPNGSSQFWQQARAFSTRQSLGGEAVTQLLKLLFDLREKKNGHIRSKGLQGPWENIKLIHQISSNIIVLHDWPLNSSAINLSKSYWL